MPDTYFTRSFMDNWSYVIDHLMSSMFNIVKQENSNVAPSLWNCHFSHIIPTLHHKLLLATIVTILLLARGLFADVEDFFK